MNRGFEDDDLGQVDGDGSSPLSPFATTMKAAPWLREGIPPWHLWGNTARIALEITTASSTSVPLRVPGQLTKVAYKRPETWHWLFTARVLEADDAEPDEPLQLTIAWDLTVGIGRAVQQNQGFDQWNLFWGTPTNPTNFAPRGALLWATETYQRSLRRTIFLAAPLTEPPNMIDEIVAQDIQLNATAFLASPVSPLTVDKRVLIEVGAQWAPKTHIRPDWYTDGPPEATFGGAETAGK